ncbi:MAG TPA: right-handed parallel beta-helix repeat-containing protein [Planctomycetota bacterium]|nr:right-handed parallel beta-helix repeat-containing protein [Planctomycetota bacterium]HRR79024.1 right-handed parallel beta-helix repeat-containing protein [Planctomycetota bacterium]HRT93835.1 right-handed parallel beta-helix repeat-containing protein [Planctomycetota bacterium]
MADGQWHSLLALALLGAGRLIPLACAAGPPAGAVRTGPDDPASLQRGIEAAARAGLKSVRVPEGTYRPPTPDRGPYLRFEGLADLEIDARGVTLARTDPTRGGIEFVRCRNVALRGMTLVNETPPFTQGRIEKIAPDGAWLELRVDAGYPAAYLERPQTGYVFDPRTRQWKPGSHDMGFTSGEMLGGNLVRLHFHHPIRPAAEALEAGDLMAFRGPGQRDILVAGCSGMRIEGVAILAGGGFCIHDDGGEGGNHYSYTVTYGPKPPGATAAPLIACNADAFHSSGARKGPTLDGCRFEGMPDDGVAIHGTYAMVIEAEGKDWVIATRWGNFFRAGDPLRLFDLQGALAGEATVVAVNRAEGYTPKALPDDKHFKETRNFWRLTLDRPLPAAALGCRISTPAANGSGYVVRHCVIRNHRARGLLLKADDGLVEGNTVDGSTIAALIIAPEYWWNEACYSRHVVVRGNTFRRAGYATTGAWDARPGIVSIAGEGDRKGIAHGHQHIVLEGNTFLENDGINLFVDGAQDVLVKGNRFDRAQGRPSRRGADRGFDPGVLIWLSNCEGVRFENNTVAARGPCGTALLKATVTAVRLVGDKDGVTVGR